MSDGSAKPVIFISYSHKDEPEKPGSDEVAWLTFVQSFLAPVVKTGIFDIWVDEHLLGGDVLDPEIKKKLADCDIFVLLASRFSLASTYVVETEIATIRQRQKDGEDVHMFPIVLSPVPNAALKQLKDLLLRPKDGKPLSLMTKNDREVAMAEIADDIAKLAEQIVTRKTAIKIEGRTSLGRFRTNDALFLELARPTNPQVSVDTAHLPETPYERLVGREVQLKRLDEAWVDRNVNILSLIAEGGAGKSALVNEWLKGMQADSYRGAETVLGWSFYSQGTKERATSAEVFLNWAIEKLGIEIETTNTAAKGEAIAEAMGRRRILMVLDGCEPLQHGLDKQQGELKDQGLRALLRHFASMPPAEVHGLVVLTSRLPVKDIARWIGSAAAVVDVEKLSDQAGAALLRDNGVWGTDKELQAAARGFGGHPLALGLLASFLKETQFGDVRRRDHIRAFFADPENPRHDHAKRVMESYEKEWLSNQPLLLAIMRMIGLFDRPASSHSLQVLREFPPISGFPASISDIGTEDWNRAVERLRQAKLLAPPEPSNPATLDAHPLVREWFGGRFLETSRGGWRVAHSRLYEHLRDTTNEGETPTLERLAPLYQSIAHGCQAGRHQEVLDDVYRDRICRRNPDGTLEYFAMKNLGAAGSELAAINWFFEKPYETPASALGARDRISVLSIAAFYLRTQGRFAESISAQSALLKVLMESFDWKYGGGGRFSRLSHWVADRSRIELLVGHIADAVGSAAESVKLADRGTHVQGKSSARVVQANALQASGKREDARRLLIDAEQRFAGLGRKNKQNFSFSDLLLAKSRWMLPVKIDWIAVRAQAAEALKMSTGANVLQFGLHAYTLARADFMVTLLSVNERAADGATSRTDASAARVGLDDVLERLRTAGDLSFITLGLLARAAFRRNVGDCDGSARDLEEVEEIAEPGPMRLYLCDMALERARLAFAKIEAFAPLNGLIDDSPAKPVVPDATETARLKEEAAKQLAIAANYISTCGYHRRDEELAELQAVLCGERKFAELPPRV